MIDIKYMSKYILCKKSPESATDSGDRHFLFGFFCRVYLRLIIAHSKSAARCAFCGRISDADPDVLWQNMTTWAALWDALCNAVSNLVIVGRLLGR